MPIKKLIQNNRLAFYLGVGALLVILLSGLFYQTFVSARANDESTLILINADNQEIELEVELATNTAQMARGLMHRKEMPEKAGMLFWFGGEEAERGFWMKNTFIPLDLLFIKGDGTIHHIHPHAIPHDLTSIRSHGAVAAVLEINAGLSEKWNITTGNKVRHPYFKHK